MLVATLTIETSPVLIGTFVLFAIIGFVAYVNVSSKWLIKVIADYKKSRKPKPPVQVQPTLHWDYNESAPVHVRIAYIVRFWLETIDPAYGTQPSAVIGTPTSAIVNIAIFDPSLTDTSWLPGLAGSWYCKLDQYIFIDSDLLDLVGCFEPIMPVEHIYCADSREGGIILFFHPSLSNEPAH